MEGLENLAALTEAKNEKDDKTQAQVLIELAMEAELWHSPDGDCYATIPINGHLENWAIKTKSFRRWLVRLYYQVHNKPPGSQALQDALTILEAKAQYDGAEFAVFTRLAGVDNTIFLDLSNPEWEVVEISAAGLRVVTNSPVKFRRTKGMLPLPKPVENGKLDELRRFINVADDESWILIVSWLIAALRPTGPYPILLLQGEQGTAKSTTAKVVRSLIDASTAPLRATPRDERDLMIAANNGWVVAFDNLSGVPNWLSDALCRLATGGGFSTRELYSNDEETLFDAMRPISLNGIDELSSRQDLMDRVINLTLPPIAEGSRKDEGEFWKAYEEAKPRILGGVLSAISAGLRNISSVKLDKLPRMADYAKWVSACEPALPWQTGEFMAAYSGNRIETVEAALESDPVAVAVRALAARGEWQGTASELLKKLDEFVDDETYRQKYWPKTAKQLANKLRRTATFLRQSNVDVQFTREATKSRKRLIRISMFSIVHNVHTVHFGEMSRENDGRSKDGWTVASSTTTTSSTKKHSHIKEVDDADDVDAEKHTYSKSSNLDFDASNELLEVEI